MVVVDGGEMRLLRGMLIGFAKGGDSDDDDDDDEDDEEDEDDSDASLPLRCVSGNILLERMIMNLSFSFQGSQMLVRQEGQRDKKGHCPAASCK